MENSSGNEEIIFPSCILPTTIREYGYNVSRAMNSNPDYFFATSLICLSIALGSTVKALVKKGWAESAMIWIVIVGDPGSKKTPSINKGLEPLFILQKLYGGNANVEVNGKPRILFTTDSTIESLFEQLYNNPHGLLLFKDELIGWIASMNQYKSGGSGDDMEKYLSIWSSQVVVITRKGKENIQVNLPFVSVVGGIQNEVLVKLTTMIGNGFTDRLLFVNPKPIQIKHTDEDLAEDMAKKYEELIHFIYHSQFEAEFRFIEFTSEAKEMWRSWHITFCDKMNSNIPSYMKNIMSKMEAYCIRFALILEFSHKAEMRQKVDFINSISVEGAIKLVDYFLANAENTFNSFESAKINNQIERAVAFISKERTGTVTLRRFYTNKVGGVKNSEEALNLLTEMRARGMGSFENVSEGIAGKQTLNFRLSPKFIIKNPQSNSDNT